MLCLREVLEEKKIYTVICLSVAIVILYHVINERSIVRARVQFSRLCSGSRNGRTVEKSDGRASARGSDGKGR